MSSAGERLSVPAMVALMVCVFPRRGRAPSRPILVRTRASGGNSGGTRGGVGRLHARHSGPWRATGARAWAPSLRAWQGFIARNTLVEFYNLHPETKVLAGALALFGEGGGVEVSERCEELVPEGLGFQRKPGGTVRGSRFSIESI